MTDVLDSWAHGKRATWLFLRLRGCSNALSGRISERRGRFGGGYGQSTLGCIFFNHDQGHSYFTSLFDLAYGGKQIQVLTDTHCLLAHDVTSFVSWYPFIQLFKLRSLAEHPTFFRILWFDLFDPTSIYVSSCPSDFPKLISIKSVFLFEMHTLFLDILIDSGYCYEHSLFYAIPTLTRFSNDPVKQQGTIRNSNASFL